MIYCNEIVSRVDASAYGRGSLGTVEVCGFSRKCESCRADEQRKPTPIMDQRPCDSCEDSAAFAPETACVVCRFMHDMGDEVLDYLENTQGELPVPPQGCSWSGMAVFYLSCAVELWAAGAEYEALDTLLEGDGE